MTNEPVVPIPHSKEAPISPARVTVHGDIAKKMTVGEPASMKVMGKIKSIQQNYEHADHYDVEIHEPHIEHIDSEGADENLAKMPKEMLKKRISKPTIEQ